MKHETQEVRQQFHHFDMFSGRNTKCGLGLQHFDILYIVVKKIKKIQTICTGSLSAVCRFPK